MRKLFSFSQRLHHHADFQRILLSKGLADQWLIVYSEKNGLAFERLGIIVSKHVESKAVSRNRIKRMVREAFRQSTAESPSCLDIVIRVRKRLSDEKVVEFRQSLFNMLMKMRKTRNDALSSIFD